MNSLSSNFSSNTVPVDRNRSVEQPSQQTPSDPVDHVTIGVSLRDMSPIWGPQPSEFRIPMFVRGLC